MQLYRVDRFLMAAALIMMSIPIFALISFAIWGRKRRRNMLDALPTSADEKVTELLGTGKVPDSQMSLKDYLQQRYKDAHSFSTYSVPVLMFHIIYICGLYWAFLTVEYAITGGTSGLWNDYTEPLVKTTLIPAVGFLGAGLLTVRYLIWRAIRLDLQPVAFLHFSYRLVAAPFFAFFTADFVELTTDKKGMILLCAFLAGLLPESAFRFLESKWKQFTAQKSGGQILPLTEIQGLEANDELRLWEEGITDAQHLAVESVVNLLVHTTYSLECIIDWKDQALLYFYVEDEFTKWRKLQIRGAMDVLGCAPLYYKPADRFDRLRAAISKELNKEEPVVERFVDTIYNDPRVHQLWAFLTRAYPALPAEPFVRHPMQDVSPLPQR